MSIVVTLARKVPSRVSIPVLAAACSASLGWAAATTRDTWAYEKRLSSAEKELAVELAASKTFREEMLRRTDRMEDKIDRLVEKE